MGMYTYVNIYRSNQYKRCISRGDRINLKFVPPKKTSRHVVCEVFVNGFISLIKNWTAPCFDPSPFVSNILITVHAKCIQ